MRREFKAIACFECKPDELMDTWPEWCVKILEFAKMESVSHPYIKRLLKRLEEADKYSDPQGE